MKAAFHAIDMETWPRVQTYNYFTEMGRILDVQKNHYDIYFDNAFGL